MRRELYHGGLSNIGKTFAVFVAFIYKEAFFNRADIATLCTTYPGFETAVAKAAHYHTVLRYYPKNVAVTDELPQPHNHIYGFAVSPEELAEPDAGNFAGVRFYGFKNASLLK